MNSEHSLDDTIPVREEERFDPEQLARYLKGRLEEADHVPLVRQFPGGKANLTYLLSYPKREYVLRRPPLGPVAPSAHDMQREFRVLSVLYRAYPLAPRAFLYCADPDIVGAPFLVMERRHGIVVRRRMPSAFALLDGAGSCISRSLVKSLSDFHAVDYMALDLGTLGRPAGFLERQVSGWAQRWAKAAEAPLPEMEACAQWLSDNVPAKSDSTLVHNDFKLDNLMFAPRDPGEPVAVFDWDMCTLGDPLSDLGSLLAYWSEPQDPPDLRAMATMPQAGFWSRRQLVEFYAQTSGRDVRQVPFYHCLGLFRLAVIVAQIYARYLRHQTTDSRFAEFDRWIPVLAKKALRVAADDA